MSEHYYIWNCKNYSSSVSRPEEWGAMKIYKQCYNGNRSMQWSTSHTQSYKASTKLIPSRTVHITTALSLLSSCSLKTNIMKEQNYDSEDNNKAVEWTKSLYMPSHWETIMCFENASKWWSSIWNVTLYKTT